MATQNATVNTRFGRVQHILREAANGHAAAHGGQRWTNTFANYEKLNEGGETCMRPKPVTWRRILANNMGSGFCGSMCLVSSTYV